MRSFAATTALASCALVTSTFASPLVGDGIQLLSARDVFVDSTSNCRAIVYGAKSNPSGETCVGITEGTMTVTANVADNWVLKDVHILISTSEFTTATETSPGQFPYGTHKGSCIKSGLMATCAIPMRPEWRLCDKPLYLAVHVAATTPTGASETGWGKGSCYDSKGNCAKYWTFNTACTCPVIYDFEPITTTKTYVTTITTSSAYTVTFPSVQTITSCNDPYAAQTTSHVTQTTTLSAGWEPPAERK